MSLFVASRLYNLPPEEAKLIQDYLDRVRSYVTRHALSSELIEDLEGNLAEKLDAILAQGTHTIKDILWAIESLWEPEEVFAFEDAARSTTSTATPGAKDLLRGFFARPWRKDRINGELFGVCAGIAKELEVNALWVRITFVALTFASGFGILLYLLLILLMEKDTSAQTTDAKHFADTVITKVSSDAPSVVSNTTTLRTLPSKALELVILVVNLAVGIWALMGSIVLAILLGWVHSNLSFSNIDFSAAIPQTGYIAGAVGLLTVFIFTVCLLGRAAGRKTWNIVSIGALLAGLLLTVGLTTRAVSEGVSKFNTQGSRQVTQTLTGVANGTYNLYYLHPNGFMLDDPYITIERSNSVATGTILIKNELNGWGSENQEVKQSLEQFISTEGRIQEKDLVLQRPSSNYFTAKSPYIFVHERITVVVPPGIEVKEYTYEPSYRKSRNAKKKTDRENKIETPVSEEMQAREDQEPEMIIQPPVVPPTKIATGSTQR